jgi:small subunit ribosomal protein S1
MSDTDQPADAPAPTPEAPAPQPGQNQRPRMLHRPAPRPGGPRPPRDSRPPRPEPMPEKPPVAEEQDFGRGPRLRDLDASIEKELEEAMGGLSGKELYGEPPRGKPQVPPDGSPPGRKKGKVIAVHGADVFVQVPGGRSEGLLPLAQFEGETPAVGSEVEVRIEGYDPANGLLLLTRQGAAVEADWSTVAEGMIVEARVTETNKGGLTVDVSGLRGFLPISQIDLYRVEQPEQFLNQRLKCLVTEVNKEERNLVVSRRALLEKEREEQREKTWISLAEGQVREGIVRSVRDFGAFVDLGGVDGLVHVSEMSWQRVQNPADLVKPGETVKVVVLRIDPETRKIALGLKQLQASPWDTISENYPEGSTVKGKVTRTADFGAFVELEPGIEGLIHISELSGQRVRRVTDVVQVGQEVSVVVLTIDKGQRRIGLSLKAAQPQAVEEPEEEEEGPVEVKPPRPRTTPLRGGLGG